MSVNYSFMSGYKKKYSFELDGKNLYFLNLINFVTKKNVWVNINNLIGINSNVKISTKNRYSRILTTKFLALCAFYAEYGSSVLTTLTLNPNSGPNVYIATNIATDDNFLYLISLTPKTINKNLKALRNSSITINGNSYYFVSYYDSVKKEIQLYDPPNNATTIIDISKSIIDRYKRLLNDFKKLKGETLVVDEYVVKEIKSSEDRVFRVGLSRKIIESEIIDLNLLKEFKKYEDSKKLICAGIYIEII